MKDIVRMLTDGELFKIKSCNESFVKAIVLLVSNTGLKTGEVRKLKISDVQDLQGNLKKEINVEYYIKFRNRQVRIGNRTVPLNQTALKQIKYLIDYSKKKIGKEFSMESYLLSNRLNKVISTNYIYLMMSKFRKQLEITDLSLGLCRHHFALSLVKKGVNFKWIQTVLGHTRIDTTLDIYGIVFDDELKTAVQSLD